MGPILWHALNFVDRFLPVSQHGYLGVDFFFMLSGFVLAHVHAEEMRHPTWRLYGRFLALRLGRIWPAYLAVLLALGGFIAWREQWWLDWFSAEQQRFLLHVFLLQAWGFVTINEFNWPGWSVSAEWFVYLLFPLYVLALGRATRIVALLAIPLLIVLLAVIVAATGHSGLRDGNYGLGLVRAILEFAMGLLLWRLYCDPAVGGWNWSAIGTAALAGLLVLLAVTKPVALTDFLFLGVFAMLMLSLAYGRGLPARICSLRPIVFLGEASYCIYLVHFALLFKIAALLHQHGQDLSPLADAVIGIGATVAASIVVGIALHLLVERPCRRWVRRRLGYASYAP
jgi:peptidoglycan/LPS O-acetylase OafA/YrhL